MTGNNNYARQIEDERIFVTPEMALAWLGDNVHNRNMKFGSVAQFANDMKNNNWRYVGDPIRFATVDEDGTPLARRILLDGQNRLRAVVSSECTVEFRVETGYAPSDQQYMDIGTPRSLADTLSLHPARFKNPKILAAVARRVYNWETTGEATGNKRGETSNHDVTAMILELRDRLDPAVEFAYRSSHDFLTQTIHGFLFYMLSNIDADDARWFLQRVEDGADMAANHPIMALRRRIIREREAAGKRLDDFYLTGYTIIAWNAYRRGITLEKIQLPRGGLTLATFPEPK